MCEDRGINHSDCRTGRKVIFSTSLSPVSSMSSWYVFGHVAKVSFVLLEMKRRLINVKAFIMNPPYVVILWLSCEIRD